MTIKTNDILPNGAIIIDYDSIINKVLAYNRGSYQPWVIWDIMEDMSCYNGRYYTKSAKAFTDWNDLTR